MRADNLIIVGLGLAAIGFALAVIVRWHGLPTRSSPIVAPEGKQVRNVAFATAGWSLAAVLAAGAVAGLLVGGLVGRLVMRIAAAVSEPEVQGRLTEADELIGEITFSGTAAFMIFVGLFGGVVAAGLYLLVRPWLPGSALASGAMIGIVVMGLFGPGDPLDPENVDFALLSHDALSVVMIVGASLLFGLAFAALAARFDVLARSSSRWRYLMLPAFAVVLFPPIGLMVVAYLAGRTFLPNRLGPLLARRPVQVVGRVLLCVLVAVMAVRLVIAAVDIIGL
ncbi:hypothetical protein ACE2AJ_05725 [Aquihabitans daechungensis]|uniref:hypothetical protein n=1 Tax=Aquihabitans daechungensis TaxID=1052257 RepID=UPI003BA33F3E